MLWLLQVENTFEDHDDDDDNDDDDNDDQVYHEQKSQTPYKCNQ